MLLKQILEHMEAGELVNHAHHGAMKSKSTQTLAMELYNELLENVKNDKEIALITLDQSKAFEIVDHEILLRKMKHIGFTDTTLKTMKSYLTTRKQYVQVAGRDSEKLLVGDNSVTQGSTLSCTIYLIYVLDLPAIFHEEMHNPKDEMNCKGTKAKTFVDDAILTTTQGQHKDITQAIETTIEKMENYMKSNKLCLNKDKTKVMILTKNDNLKKNFKMVVQEKTITHQKNLKILGNIFNENLDWNDHVNKEVLPSLRNRARSLKLVNKYINPKFRLNYSTAIFKSKLNFGLETWGGISQELKTKLQKVQNSVTKYVVPKELQYKSPRLRHKHLEWLSIEAEIQQATHKATYKILNQGQPEILHLKMPMNTNSTRMKAHKKLHTKPKWLTSKDIYRKSFQNRAYNYNTLKKEITSADSKTKFKKLIKQHMISQDRWF